MECHHESLSGNKGEHGGNQNGIRHYTTRIKRPHGSHHLCRRELDLGGLAHAEKVHQSCRKVKVQVEAEMIQLKSSLTTHSGILKKDGVRQ
jgi:hypothetical protein